MMSCTENDAILRCHEAYDYKKRIWIFLDLMNAGALTQFIEECNGQYTEAFCKYVTYRSLLGLKYLHDRSILHRDLKSDNILCDTQGNIVLADFGYAVQLTKENAKRASRVGTACWMAPELIRGKVKYDTKADVWSFGIFLLELADGDPPYINVE